MKTKLLEIIYQQQSFQIEYFVRPGKEKTILFIHGLGCSKNDFSAALNIDELQEHTIAAFDFPGCGNSSYPEHLSLGMDDLVEITKLIVEKLSLERFVVLGHSMGGLVALLYCLKYKEQVIGFINVEGNLASEDCFLSRKILQLSFTEFLETALPELKEKLSQSENIGFRKYLETLEKYSSPKAYYDFCPSLVDYSDNGNLIQQFINLKIPKIFIYGSENSSLSYIPLLKNEGCETTEIANSGHALFYDNPKGFYKAVSIFLKTK